MLDILQHRQSTLLDFLTQKWLLRAKGTKAGLWLSCHSSFCPRPPSSYWCSYHLPSLEKELKVALKLSTQVNVAFQRTTLPADRAIVNQYSEHTWVGQSRSWGGPFWHLTSYGTKAFKLTEKGTETTWRKKKKDDKHSPHYPETAPWV